MMPTLETPDGKPVDVTPAEDINRQFENVMNDDGPDEQAPPKRRRAEPTAEDAPKTRRARPPKSEQPRTTAKNVTALDDGARAQGVKGLAQLGAGLALMLGKVTRNDAFVADALTINSAADEIADACVQTAKADAGFAAALDRVCNAGPYAALITVGVTVAAQLARNHRPALAIPGTVDPGKLIAMAAEQAEQPVPAAA